MERKWLIRECFFGLVIIVLSAFVSYLISTSIVAASGHDVVIRTVTVEDQTTKTEGSLASVIGQIQNEVVDVTATLTNGVSSGSGVLFSRDDRYTYIVTNHHVIGGASDFSVNFQNGDVYEAILVGSDPIGDLAVLKIETTAFEVASFIENSDTLKVGNTVIAIGNPLGELGGTVSKGIISAIGRKINVDGRTMTLLQTDASVNSGNSGGGLFDEHGLLIGIVNAKAAQVGVEGLAFAIPSNTVKEIAIDLLSYGYVPGRPAVGAVFSNGLIQEGGWFGNTYDIVYVSDIDTDGACYKAGMRKGDIIIAITDGGVKTAVTDASDVTAAIESHQIGEQLTFTVKRRSLDSEEMTFPVTLEQYVYRIS